MLKDPVHLSDIIELAHVESISELLRPTYESKWRYYCRVYSKTFHTEYAKVLEMSPEFVIKTIFDDRLEDVDLEEDLEELMDRVYTIEDPNYDSEKEQEIREFVKQANAMEKKRLKDGAPIPRASKKTVPKTEEPIDPDKPTEGFVNFDFLNQDKES